MNITLTDILRDAGIDTPVRVGKVHMWKDADTGVVVAVCHTTYQNPDEPVPVYREYRVINPDGTIVTRFFTPKP